MDRDAMPLLTELDRSRRRVSINMTPLTGLADLRTSAGTRVHPLLSGDCRDDPRVKAEI